MDLTQYYLDLEKINSLDKETANKIHEYYRDMIYTHEDGRKGISTSLFNTLNNNGYLKNIRDEKLGLILDGNNRINN
jgi:hypothetical protein